MYLRGLTPVPTNEFYVEFTATAPLNRPSVVTKVPARREGILSLAHNNYFSHNHRSCIHNRYSSPQLLDEHECFNSIDDFLILHTYDFTDYQHHKFIKSLTVVPAKTVPKPIVY